MTENNGPNFEKFGGMETSVPWYAKLLPGLNDRAIAITGIIAFNYLVAPLPEQFAYASLAAITVLGLASAMIRKRE